MRSIILSIVIVLFCHLCVVAQPNKLFSPTEYSNQDYTELKQILGRHKTIPAQFERQILLALTYFPELMDADIEFRIRKVRTPLASRPAWTSIIRPKHQRKYVITISDQTMNELSPILLKKLDFNAQVGVLGHELSHVADFSSRNTLGLMRIGLGNLSQRFLDRFEYGTDSICIAHGLGYQLLAWSTFVRKAFHESNYEGADNIADKVMARERYMNPATITRRMAAISMYQKL